MKLSETMCLGTVPYTRFFFLIFYRSRLYKSGFPLLQIVAENFLSGSSHGSVYHSGLMQTQARACLKMHAWAAALLVWASGMCLHPADLAPIVTTTTTTTTATTASRVCSCCAESPVGGGAAASAAVGSPTQVEPKRRWWCWGCELPSDVEAHLERRRARST